MRWAFSKAFLLLGWALNFAMFANLFIALQAGADWFRLLLIFFAYVIPIVLLLDWSNKLKEPRTAPRQAQVAPSLPIETQPIPEAPQEPQGRRFAVPPTVGATNPVKAPVRASMAPQLREFVSKGERAITEDD